MGTKVTESNRPLRVLDRALQGGLGTGNLGLLMSRHGTGKVAILTSMGIDHAMDGRNALHVAVGKTVRDIRALHDQVYEAMVAAFGNSKTPDIRTVERHKQIYTYQDGSLNVGRLRETLAFLGEHAQFRPEMIEIQGWPDFESGPPADEIQGLKKLAEDFKAEIWITAQTHRTDEVDSTGVPSVIQSILGDLAVVLALDEDGDHMNVRFVKTHDTPPTTSIHLEFDPKTMLLRWR